MAAARDEVIEEIRARVDIVDLVGEHVRLRRVGRSYVGLCPFHAEKTPSFHVSPERQMFYCFGCQTGGDAFRFVMLKQGVEFPEALRILAERAGVRLPERDETPEQRRQRQERERLLEALEWATRWYQHQLRATPAGQAARDYLARRGIDPSTMERFRFGWAPPDGTSLVDAMRKRGFEPEVLLRAGLAGAREGAGGHPERLYDWLRGRIVIPIADERGRVIGFGGRVLGDGEPKYLNSPETPLFRKRHVWFGLDRARAAIRREGCALVVEGYLDAIACHRLGIEWAVASLGTALSEDQARVLARLAGEIYIAYDSDAAGQAATIRGIDHFRRLAPDATVKVAVLPPGEDPDSFLGRHGAEAFLALLERAPDYIEYRFERALSAAGEGVAGRVRAAREIVPLLAELSSPVARDAYIHRFAPLLGVSAAALRSEVGRFRHKGTRERAIDTDELASRGTRRSGSRPVDPGLRAERELLRLLVSSPRRIADVLAEGLNPEELAGPGHGALLAALLAEGEPAGEDEPERVHWLHRVFDRLDDDRARALLSELSVAAPLEDRDGLARQLVASIRDHALGREERRVLREIDECERRGDAERVRQLLQYQLLLRQIRERRRSGQEIPEQLLRTLRDLQGQLRGA